MSRTAERTAIQIVSLAGFVLCVGIAVWGWHSGVLTSQERLQALVDSCGSAGVLLFVAFQAVQVVVPILPGGLGCLAGVVLFGAKWGFVYNYVGICIGSLMAFAVARCCRCCFRKRPSSATAAGQRKRTGLPGGLHWRFFCRWRRTISCAIWQAPRKCPGGSSP